MVAAQPKILNTLFISLLHSIRVLNQSLHSGGDEIPKQDTDHHQEWVGKDLGETVLC